MADEDVILEFKKKAEHLQPYIEDIDYKSYQLEDGKLFYLVYSKELRLKWRGNYFYKDLYDEDLKDMDLIERENAKKVFGMGAFKNELYYIQNKKIFKAFFVFPDIKVSFVRHMHEREKVEGDGFCTRMDDGRKLVYRLNEDFKSGFPLTSESDDGYAAGGYLLERKLGYTANDFWLIKRDEKSFVTDFFAKCYVGDDNTIYISNNDKLALIRNGEMELLPYIGIPSSSLVHFIKIHKIVGVYNGVITVEVETKDIKCHTIKKELWTARLNTVERKETTAAMLEAIHELTAEMKELRKNQEQLTDGVVKINESLNKIIARK